MLYEFSHSLQVILRKLFNIVMARHLDEIRIKSFVLNILPKSMPVTNMDDLISLPMNNIYRAIKVFDSIDVGKMIEPKSPSQIWEHNSES